MVWRVRKERDIGTVLSLREQEEKTTLCAFATIFLAIAAKKFKKNLD